MSNLTITPVDLTAVAQKVPLNGSPSSKAYNDNVRDVLADLANIAHTLNNVFLPILSGLDSSAADGLDGRSLLASTDNLKSSLFYSTQDQKFYSVAEVLKNVQSDQHAISRVLANVQAEITRIRSQTSANQSSVIYNIQGFTQQLNEVMTSQNAITQALQTFQTAINSFASMRIATPAINHSQTAVVVVNWGNPFIDNNYTVTPSIEDLTNSLAFTWNKLPAGVGVSVTVKNTSTTLDAVIGVINLIAVHDQ